jgi:membrane protein DedA with SNARE-associated domain
VDTILQYFFEYRYAVIFLGTFIEGEIILIVGGFLVSEGDLSFSSLVSLATTASVAGDNCFYWLGRSQAVETKHPWCVRLVNFIGEKRLFKGEEFVRRHGGKSVFFLRFLYGLRCAGALTAGLLGMGFKRFFLSNFLGCLTWATSISSLGYLFGKSLEAIAQGVKLAEIGFVLIVTGLIAIYFLRRRTRGETPRNPFEGRG